MKTATVPCSVLVTGGTGALGSALLPLLLAHGLQVWVLSRTPQALPPMDGLRVLRGDICLPKLGLTAAQWTALGQEIDTVVHLAADLHALADLEALWPVNVQGTRRVLELAAAGRPKAVHHASTLAVFACSEQPAGRVKPTSPLPSHGRIRGGYAQSKWAAEWLARGAGATVHRFGLLVGEQPTGLLRQVIRGLADPGVQGALAEVASLEVDCNYTPIGVAAQALAEQVLAGSSGTSHLVSPSRFSLGQLVRALDGRRVQAHPLERALAERILVAPLARHPSNLFLSTGWAWGGSLPAAQVPLEAWVNSALQDSALQDSALQDSAPLENPKPERPVSSKERP